MNFQFSRLRCLLLLPLISILLFLVTSSILAPYFAASGMIREYKFLNALNSLICHQYPQRCLVLFDYKLGLCARCFSFFCSSLMFSVMFLFVDINIEKKLRLLIFYSLISPLVVDGITQYFQFRVSTNFIRSITGSMAGIGVSIVLVPKYFRTSILLFNKLKLGV